MPGTLTLAQLTERLGLIGPIVEKVLNFMRREAKVEIKPRLEGSGSLPYALTDRGRSFGTRRLHAQRLPGGTGASRRLRQGRPSPERASRAKSTARLRKAFEDMYMPENAADKFGISVNSGRPVFIYGPAGTGKTYVTHRLAGCSATSCSFRVRSRSTKLSSKCSIRCCTSRRCRRKAEHHATHGHDARYVACERPVIITGGELTIDLA